METINSAASIRVPWNKGKLVGQKAPFKLKEIWAIRVRLQIASRCREQPRSLMSKRISGSIPAQRLELCLESRSDRVSAASERAAKKNG